jgi:hypothetical protein
VERRIDLLLLQVDNCSAGGNLLRGREEKGKWKGKERNKRRKIKL